MKPKDAEDLRRFLSDQTDKADKAFGFTEDQCAQLIYLYLSQIKHGLPLGAVGVPLNVCVNRPPCKNNEEEVIYRQNRKWCKGADKIGSQGFIDKATTILDKANAERKARVETMSTEDIKEVTETEKFLDDFEFRLDTLLEDKAEAILEQRFTNLMKDEPTPRDLEKKFKTETRDIQKKKKELESTVTLLTVTKDIIKSVKTDISTSDETRHREAINTRDFQETNKNIAQGFSQMTALISQLSNELQSQKNQIKELETKQEYVNRAARKTLGEEYWSEQLTTLFRGGVKSGLVSAAKMPFRIFNIVVFQPARHAFWHFFGRWAYLIWGMLMMMLLTCCILSFYLYADKHYPDWVALLVKSTTYIWSAAVETGSIFAKSLQPIFGESIMIIIDGVYSGISQAKELAIETLQALIAMIIESFRNVFTWRPW